MRDGGKNVFYRVNGLMNHQLAETIILAVAACCRFLITAFPVLTQSLMLQLDVLRRTSVTLNNISRTLVFHSRLNEKCN